MKCKTRKIIISIVIIFVLSSIIGSQRKAYGNYEEVKKLRTIVFAMEKDIEEYGITVKELKDFINLRVKNSFRDIPFDTEAERDRTDTLLITFHIAIGGPSPYPVAWYIDITISHYSPTKGGDWKFWNYSMGIMNEEEMKKEIKKAIEGLIDQMAIHFYKSRGDMP